MSSKSERERRRAERVAAEKAATDAARRRLIFGYVAAGVLALAVVVGIGVVIASGGDDTDQVNGQDIPEAAHIQVNSGFLHGVTPDGRKGTPPPPLRQGDLQKAAAAAGCELSSTSPTRAPTTSPRRARSPTTAPTRRPRATTIPSSRPTAPTAVQPAPWYVVHSMEHGRVEIQYSPDLSEADQLALKGVFDENAPGVLFFPNADMPYEVAVTAWTQLMGCKSYKGAATLDAIRDFRDTYRGLGPEAQVPIVTG